MRVLSVFFEKSKEWKNIFIFLGIILFSYYLGKNIVYQSPYIWLFFASIPVLFLVLKKYEIGIYFIMFSVFFSDWLIGLGYIPTQLSWLPEIVLIIYFIKFLIERRSLARTPIDTPIFFFIIVGIASVMLNSLSPISLILAFRLDLKFILMFYILVSINLQTKTLKKMMGVLIFLFIIQVPVAYFKYTIYGQNEFAVGTYTHFGGGLSTILPLFAISLFTGMYLYYKSHIKYLFYILGFLFFPIFAGKRGFLFFGILLLLFLIWQSKEKLRRKLVPISLIIIFGLFASIIFVPTWRNVLDNPRFMYDYTISYTYQRDLHGSAGGRMSAIQETYQNLEQDPLNFLIGKGPGSTIKSFFPGYSRKGVSMPVNISYGFTHLVSTVIDYGYLGFILYFLFPIILLFKANRSFFRNIKNKFWQAMSFGFGGILFSSLLIGLFYWELFRVDVSAFVFWFFAAAVYSVNSRKNSNTQ